MDIVASTVLYCAGAAAGAWVCLKTWREGGFAPAKTYQPERYYMRGPGPKWREKHASGRMSGIR